jgi:two-component system CheB/CheR fusion protein
MKTMAQAPKPDTPMVPPPGRPAEDFMVVGLGASAGGLKALLELFQHVPPDTGMAFVVVVHLSPEHESRMADLLQQATKMPVRAVTEALNIVPDNVYVISPNSQLRMYDGKLEPTEVAKHRGGRMTIDVFLETLANAHKHRSVGVVLSGTGSDGTLGIRAIKAAGGITLAQAPEEAEYDSMPRSAIASGVVDFVMPVRDMPAKLQSVWRNAQAIRMPALPDQPTPEDAVAEAEEAIRDILATLRTRTGHDFSQYKRATLMRRLERRLQVNQLRNLGQYRKFIAENADEGHALLRDLLISVTWFFRDPAAWKAIEDRVIPDLLKTRSTGNIRVWVVGCATGEEVYTLAMLLQERLQTMSSPPTVNIFATDIDEEALGTARAGVYPESISEQMTPERLRRFFVREAGNYRIQKQLREMVMFAVHNVIQDPPFSRLDFVSCRNLLIYLTRHVQSKVLDLLHFSLKPDGYLFLGMSESIEDGHDGFTVLDKSGRIFMQQPRARMGLTLATLPAVQPPRFANDLAANGGRRTVSFGDLHQRMLEHYAPPSVIVDDRFEIIHLSDRAGHFLQFGPGEASLNLLKMAPEEARYDLKSLLEQALESMRTVEHAGLMMRRGPGSLPVNVRVFPVRDRASARTFALVIFEEPGEEPGPLEVVTDASPSETSALEERVRVMESQLRAAVEQYEVQNEELKASNEELQATNEELRATTEELETGKEELQSINEELTTVNQELKNKVDETTRISDDLQNFVTATEIASMFVDRELRLMRYTPFAREIFNVIPGDIGRPLSDLTHRLEGIDLEEKLNEVFELLHIVETEARSSDGRWYMIRFLPYRTTDDRIRGAVLTFVDITQRKHAEAIGRRTEAWSNLVVENVRGYAIVRIDPAGTIQSWNPGAMHIFGYDEMEAIGKSAAILFTPEDRARGVPEQEMTQARETGRADDERWQLRKDGTRFFASGIMARLDAHAEHGYVKVLRDLTEQKLAEKRQSEAFAAERQSRSAAEEASRLKDEFLAMLSHELRNPLALMLMQAEILLRAPEAKKSERLRQSAKIIHEMVRAQAQLVEDMLDVSRAKTGKLTIDRQLLPLTFLIADSIGALRREAEKKNIALDVQIAEEPLIVAADSIRVRQIAWNLLSNAIKFTPAGGAVRVALTRDGDDARLEIRDTGVGIAPERLPYVFEWFRRAEPGAEGAGGMGIGLALVNQLVELHGGRLEAHSDGVGKGARFIIWLPLQITGEIAERQAPRPVAEGPRLERMRILIVDDSQANGDALRDLLELEGAVVTVENSPRSAIERGKKERFDVVISDIAMPELDGYAVMKSIRASKANADALAVAYSGYGAKADVDRARAAGFDAHLTKPVDVQTLIATIADLGKRKSAADD